MQSVDTPKRARLGPDRRAGERRAQRLEAKNPAPADWHRADIKAALEKRGWSLRRLAVFNGYAATSLNLALRSPWPRAEKLIANAIGKRPQLIWPSRYHADGAPKSGRGERLGRYRAKNSTGAAARNVHLKAVA